MSRTLWCRRCRNGMVVLASGAVISLSALTGGIAPALAAPPPPFPFIPGPPPRPAAPPPPPPRAAPPPRMEAPAPRVEAPPPVHEAPPVHQALPPVRESAPPVHESAPHPEVHDSGPAPDRDGPPVAPHAQDAPPATGNQPPVPHDGAAAPDQHGPDLHGPDQHGPNDSAPDSPPAPHDNAAPPDQHGPDQHGTNDPAPDSPPTPHGLTGPSPGPTEQHPNQPEPNQPEPGQRQGPATQNGTGHNATPRAGTPGGRPATVQRGVTTRAPQKDVASAEASVPVEHKPDPASAADVDNLRHEIQLPPTDDKGRNLGGEDWRAPGPDGNFDHGDFDHGNFDHDGWNHPLRQWDRSWVRYDADYRPIICNPYQNQLQIVYDYGGAPEIVVIPPLGSAVLDAAAYGAYNFTALVLDAAGDAIDAAVGSFFGGGYDPGWGLPQPPPPLTTYDDVPVAVDYPDATYDPFMVNQVVDAGPDPQYGEDKVLLDGVTPVWGDWAQTPDGQREFDVHKTQQFPGLDTPAPGPLPGDYQLHLANKTSSMPARDVYGVAAAAVVATAGVCAAVALTLSRRRRRRVWDDPWPLPR
jgi:hypothetical protein